MTTYTKVKIFPIHHVSTIVTCLSTILMIAYVSLMTDLCISIFLIEEVIPKRWMSRQGLVHARKLLIIMWLMLTSNILIWSYKGTLLSTLVPIYYDNPINTLEEVDRSGLPVLITKNNVVHWLMKTDPRSTINNIWQKRILYPFPGGKFPDWVTQRYVLNMMILYLHHTMTIIEW